MSDLNTDDYRNAAGGVKTPTNGGQVYDWRDKPHRLVYDLCNEIERLKAEHEQTLEAMDTALIETGWNE